MPTLLQESGPYKVESRADGTVLVTPSWPQFPPYSEDEGGGPGMFSRLGLADEIRALINN